MLPKLHTLEKVPVAGHTIHTIPFSTNCQHCGLSVAQYYRELEFVFDGWKPCDLVTSSDADVYLVSEHLLAKLQSISASGYIHRSVTISTSDDFHRVHRDPIQMPTFYYFVITGRCDGPWIHHVKGNACPICGQTRSESKDFEIWLSELAEDIPKPPTLVYPETWQGEDFFYLSEPGPPLITERIATILAETGNLRKEKVLDKDKIRRLMPKHAARLEKKNWQVEVCISLGPADWVTRAQAQYL